MKTLLATLITLCVVAAAGFVIFKSLHAATANLRGQAPAPTVKLPPAFSNLKSGMSEDDVVALIGKPDSRSVNPRYEFKTAAQWAALHKQEDAASNDSDLGGAASPTEIRIGGMLAHQVKENWMYDPKDSNAFEALSLDGTGHLLKFASGVRPRPR